MDKKPSNRDLIFIGEYLISRNPEQAALKAGYSKSMAKTKAYQWVSDSKKNSKPHIRAAVEKALEKIAKKLDVSAERIRRELAHIAFADMADHVAVSKDGTVRVKEFEEMPEGSSRVIAGIKERRRVLGDTTFEHTLEYKHHDKVKALELLGKDQGMFKEKVEHTGGIEIAITKRVISGADDKP